MSWLLISKAQFFGLLFGLSKLSFQFEISALLVFQLVVENRLLALNLLLMLLDKQKLFVFQVLYLVLKRAKFALLIFELADGRFHIGL